MKSFYTEEQVKRVCELYVAGMPVAQIEEVTGVERSNVSKIAKRNGLELRRPKKAINTKKAKRCVHCGEKLTDGFRFCPYCGKDVRTEKEICIEKLKDLQGLITLLPTGERDKMRDALNSSIAFIKGMDVKK